MFFTGSRYAKIDTYSAAKANGQVVQAVKLPLPGLAPLIGFHRRHEGQRLDLIASHYLSDATTFWRLCDANNAVVPDALGARDLIGIPQKGR
jgi:hypothetical protein